jgi:hypothetical protein
MSEAGKQSGGYAILTIADDSESDPVAANWAGSFLALGATLARHADSLDGLQLVVTLSVPRRDYVAALIGAGWTLTRPPRPGAADPLAVVDPLGTDAWYRAVNATYVYFGRLRELDATKIPPRIRYAGSHFRIDGFRRMASARVGESDTRQGRPAPGSLVRYSGAIHDWDDRLISPAQDLALVGIESRLRADLAAILTKSGDSDGDSLSTLLLPWQPQAATWFSRIYSSATLEEAPDGYKAAILDGQGAMRFMAETLSPVVVCVVDRSIADESQAENLVNMRRTEGTAVSISEMLGWRPPVGVEVMGFEARL